MTCVDCGAPTGRRPGKQRKGPVPKRCSECSAVKRRASNAAWRAKNPDYHSEWEKKRKRSRSQVKMTGPGLCLSCGATVERLRPGTHLPRRCPDCKRGHAVLSGKLRQYNLTAERLESLFAGGCAICGTNDPGRNAFAIDHDHACCRGITSCGRCVRGALCSKCNTGLGQFGDNPSLLLAALRYLIPATYHEVAA